MTLSNRGTISTINSGVSATGSFAQSAATSGLSPTVVIIIVVIAVLAGLVAAFWAIFNPQQKDIDEDPDVERARRSMKAAGDGDDGDGDLDTDEEAMRSLRGRNEDDELRPRGLQETEGHDGSLERKNGFPAPRYPDGLVVLTSLRRSHSRDSSWDSRIDEGAHGDRDQHRGRLSLLGLSGSPRVQDGEDEQGEEGLRAPEATVPPRSPRLVTGTDSGGCGRTV